MKSAIMIKKLKKYKKYNFSIDNSLKNVLIHGEEALETETNVEIDIHNLVRNTRKLGKTIYNIIIKELEKLTFELDRAIKSNVMSKEINNKIVREYINGFIKIENKNYSHYKFAFDFYSEAFELLKEQNSENIKIIDTPSLISMQLNEIENDHLWGIQFDESYNGKNVAKGYEHVFNKLNEVIDNLDCKSLLDKIDYLIYDIKYLFTSIISIEHNSEIFDAIKEWCQNYGMPFWTDRHFVSSIEKRIITEDEIIDNYSIKGVTGQESSMSRYELSENTIPIINLISISISIYLFSSLWKKYINNDKMTTDDNKKIKIIKLIIGNKSINNASIIDLINSAEYYHNYIMNNLNSIYDVKLEIYEKKEQYRSNNKLLFYNIREYESVAIAAWDVFYHDYLGNQETTNPLHYCGECHKQVQKNQSHTIKNRIILCDDCYKKRKAEKNRERVQKHRDKNK